METHADHLLRTSLSIAAMTRPQQKGASPDWEISPSQHPYKNPSVFYFLGLEKYILGCTSHGEGTSQRAKQKLKPNKEGYITSW